MSQITIATSALLAHLDKTLAPERFRDYGPNGLQVEGRAEIRHLVCGVTANLALIEAAIAKGADAILVHHGLFWRGQDGRVLGWMKQRLQALLAHDINLLAYHLPLDAHSELGNNAQLGKLLGFAPLPQHFGEQDLGWLGTTELSTAMQLQEYCTWVLGRPAQLIANDVHRPIRRVAWCSGGAQSYFEAAIAAGADVFITGELSEPQVHYARESGVAYLACGHHATERCGVQAVAREVAQAFGITQEFIDIPNPV